MMSLAQAALRKETTEFGYRDQFCQIKKFRTNKRSQEEKEHEQVLESQGTIMQRIPRTMKEEKHHEKKEINFD